MKELKKNARKIGETSLNVNKAIMGPSTQQFFFLLFRCYCHNMFRSYDHHQAADSGVLSQAVCLTAIANS
jgi:hypothetical protein